MAESACCVFVGFKCLHHALWCCGCVLVYVGPKWLCWGSAAHVSGMLAGLYCEPHPQGVGSTQQMGAGGVTITVVEGYRSF